MHRGTLNRVATAVSAAAVIILMIIGSCKFDIYRIHDSSMSPYLEDGDKILAYRLKQGRRKNLTDKVVIFYFPYKDNKPTISPDTNHLLIKRCIAGPGDSLRIDNGVVLNRRTGISTYHCRQIPAPLNPSPLFYSVITNNSYSSDDDLLNMSWIYIPKKGDTLYKRDHHLWHIYNKIIDFEYENDSIPRMDSIHVFTHDYYFVCGDNMTQSYDSRSWGFLPEEFIISYK